MGKYRIAKSPNLTAQKNIVSWSQIENYLSKRGSASLDDLIMLCSSHNHPSGGGGFVRYCIGNGWLLPVRRRSDI